VAGRRGEDALEEAWASDHPLLAPCSGCPLSRDGTIIWLAFWPLAVGLFFYKGLNA